MKNLKLLILGIFAAGMFLTMAQPASATEYDIRGGGIFTINGAKFEQFTTEGSTGTGTFKPFLQVNQLGGHPKSPVYGFCTDLALGYTVAFYATEPTYAPTLAELPKVEVGGIDYIEFVCDNNQARNAESRQLTFDELKIYQTNNNLINYSTLSGLTPIRDLDSAGDNDILFDAQFGSGSGSGDMKILIPLSLFSMSYDYVIAWVSFGGYNPDPGNDSTAVESAHPNDDGFEEFGYLIYPTEPDTMVTIVTSAAPENIIYEDTTVDLTVTEINTGTAPLYNVSVTVDNGVGTLTATTATESGTDNDILDVGETWSWTVTGVIVNAQTTFTVTGYGETEPSGGDAITYPDYPNEQASITVYTIDPYTVINISSSATTVQTGDTVDLTVTEENSGDDDLTSPYVSVSPGGYTLNKASGYYTSGDTDGDGELDSGETWTWIITGVVVNSNTTFTATGHGTDSLGNDVTYPDYIDEQDTVDVDVVNPDTLVSIDSSAYLVQAGGTVTLTVTEDNTGGVDLTSPYVEVSPGGYTLNKASGYYTSGDTDGDGELDTDEVWRWDITGVVVNSNTTFTATGHGTDSLGNDVTYDEYPDEQDTVDVDVISPDTEVTIDASAYLIYASETVTLTVTEENTGDDDLTSPYVEVSPGGYTLNKASGYYTSGDTDGDGELDTDEIWTWIITGVVVNADTTFTATGHGTDSLGNDVTYPAHEDEQDTVDVDTINPNTTVTIDSDVYETTPGGNVWLTITETNTGDDPLDTVSVVVNDGTSDIALLTYNDTSWDTTGYVYVTDDDILEPGETWSWKIQVTISVDTTFTATGYGIDSLGNDVTAPYYEYEEDSVLVEVEQEFTRTWGFWKTHLYLVEWMFSTEPYSPHITYIYLGDWGDGDMEIYDVCDYMGLMWSAQSQNSDGSSRTKIDAARIHTAAIMNSYMPNGAPLPVSLAEIADILSSNNINDIRELGSLLAYYNESGEGVAFDPNVPPTGKTSGNIADPQGARDAGALCESYWDTETDISRGKGHNK